MHADWLKIMFLELESNTELARTGDKMMAWVKKIYILIIKLNNKMFSFFHRTIFLKK